MHGDLSKAQHLIKVYDLEKASEGMYFHLWEMTQLVLLRAKVRRFKPTPNLLLAILEALSTLIAESERRERVTPVIEASILRAYAHHAVAATCRRAESLSHALTLGAQSGYIRIFADEGKASPASARTISQQNPCPAPYVEEIHKPPPQGTAQSALRTIAPRITNARLPLTPLTRRELDILQLLAAGKSNQEIARGTCADLEHGQETRGEYPIQDGCCEPHPGRDAGKESWGGDFGSTPK